jgi:hypothetical protein
MMQEMRICYPIPHIHMPRYLVGFLGSNTIIKASLAFGIFFWDA